MAAVPVTVVGILTTEAGSTNATLVGMASLTGLGVGGGPVVPPSGAHPEHPIFYPPGTQPHPEHPIALPPPSVWPPGPGIDFPQHPIVIPPPIDPGTPIPPGTLINWKTYWSEETGWVVVGVPNVPHPAPA